MSRERISGIVIAVCGLAALVLSFMIPMPPNQIEAGPRLFPIISCVGMIICGIGMTVQKPSIGGGPVLNAVVWKKLGLIVLLVLLYLVLVGVIGFFVSSTVMLFVFIKVIAGEKKVSNLACVVCSVVTNALLFVAFKYALNVVFPQGLLF